MKPPRPSQRPERITLVGGGLAGLTLGIALRRAGVPVTLFEAGRYPRHRVCGEFVSGRGRDVLRELGLEGLLLRHGATIATTTSFHSRRFSTRPQALPEPALCLSRHTMDAVLADTFSSSGGELRAGERWDGDPSLPGLVLASGRRPVPTLEGWRWFGLKAHATGVALDADLEMHLGENGYVGLCRLTGGRVNVCGLFRSRTARPDVRPWPDRLRGRPGSPLYSRLESAAFVEESMSAVAGLDFASTAAFDTDTCRIGDALAMIPPVTGNGMSIACETALAAKTPLVRWWRGDLSWPEAKAMVATELEQRLSTRLRIARALQHGLFHPAFQQPLVQIAGRSGLVLRVLFRLTR